MAVSDDDWKKFMDSTQEPPEDVETPDDPSDEDEPDEDEEPKNPKTDPKKSKNDEEENPDDPEEDEDADPEEDEEEPDPKDPPASDYKPRLKQFVKEDGTFDVAKIEQSYIDSGKQAVQLDKDLKEVRKNYGEVLGAIKANPEIAEKLFGKDGAKQLLENDNIPTSSSPGGGSGDKVDISSHPLLKHLEAEMNQKSRDEYTAFVDAHPESVTDPDKAEKIGEFFVFYGPFYQKQNGGRIAPMKEALEAAYRHYGWDLEIEKKESVASAAKKTAATRRTSSKGKAPTKKQVTQSEEFFANKLGVKLKS